MYAYLESSVENVSKQIQRSPCLMQWFMKYCFKMNTASSFDRTCGSSNLVLIVKEYQLPASVRLIVYSNLIFFHKIVITFFEINIKL